MPRADKSSYDPREAAGLVAAIPKHNLGELLEERGVKFAELAEQLGWKRSSGNRVGEWISGKRRMSNTDIIRVARLLDVSPIYLLDLSICEWPDSGNWMGMGSVGLTERRNNMLVDIGWLNAPDEAICNGIQREAELDTLRNSVVWRQVFVGLEVMFPVSDDDGSPTLSPREIKQRIGHELLSIDGDYRDLARLTIDAVVDTLNQCYDHETDILACKALGALRNLGYGWPV